MLIKASKDEIIEHILRSYEVYFDVDKYEEKDIPVVAKCRFHIHNERYVLIKKAKLWDSDSNEYVFVFKINSLTRDLFIKCRNYAYEEGMKLIEPKPGHMCSYITSVFICDSCDKEAEKMIRKCNIHKNFKFSFYGWMDYHTTCINISSNEIFGNRSGKDTTKFFKNLLNNSSILNKTPQNLV